MKARELIEQLMRLDLDCQVFVELQVTGAAEQKLKAPIDGAEWHNEDGNPHLRLTSGLEIEVTVERPEVSVSAN